MKKYVQYAIGLSVMCLGIAILVVVDLGPSSWDALSGGISDKFNITFGQATTISGILIVILCGILKKEMPKLLPMLMHIITGLLIDMWMMIPFVITLGVGSTLKLWITAFIALILMAIGINLYVKANIAPNAIDHFMITMQEITKLPFGVSKIIIDFIGLILALIMAGPVGPFTFVIIISLGTFVGLFEKLYYKIFPEELSN